MKIHKLTLYILLVTSIASPAIILILYRMHMTGEISNDPAHWAVFGSVLGGAFTLVGGLATCFALLFLYGQQRRNLQVIEKQMASLTFEQYTQHVEHFKNFMNPVGKRNRIEFADLDRLYQIIFPYNRPTSCSFYNQTDQHGHNVADALKSTIADLDIFLRNPKTQTATENIVICLLRMKESLLLNFDQHFAGNGKSTFQGRQTGIFLDRLEVQARALQNVFDELLFFSGDERTPSFGKLANWHDPVRELVKILPAQEAGAFRLDEGTNGVRGISKLHQLTQQLDSIPTLKSEIEQIYFGDKFINMLQASFLRAQGQKLAQILKSETRYKENKELSDFSEIRKILVAELDYNYLYFEENQDAT